MSRQQTARLAGALYVAMSLPGAFALVYIPRVFLVPGDATATAARIAASPALYRFGVFADLICGVFAVWLVMVLYDLFKDVDRRQARLMVGFVLAMVAIGLVNTVLMAGPLVLTSGASYLSAFDKHQLDALTLGFLGLRSQGIRAATMYWGLWLLPLGILVYRSGFLPRILGVLVIIAGCTYVVDCLAYYFFPDYARIVALASMLPQAAGEMGFTGWLLIKGVRTERLEAS
jgi:Domain of unknown function (DUF4386)